MVVMVLKFALQSVDARAPHKHSQWIHWWLSQAMGLMTQAVSGRGDASGHMKAMVLQGQLMMILHWLVAGSRKLQNTVTMPCARGPPKATGPQKSGAQAPSCRSLTMVHLRVSCGEELKTAKRERDEAQKTLDEKNSAGSLRMCSEKWYEVVTSVDWSARNGTNSRGEGMQMIRYDSMMVAPGDYFKDRFRAAQEDIRKLNQAQVGPSCQDAKMTRRCGVFFSAQLSRAFTSRHSVGP